MKKQLYTLLFGLITVYASIAHAEPNLKTVDRVAAVVNDDVITKQELDKRFQYLLRQNKFNLNRAQQQALYKKVLGNLINEQIKKQYASEHNLSVSKAEIDMAIAQIEKQNNLSKGGFYNLTFGIEDTAIEQIKTDLLWNKIIQRAISPRVVVSVTEVDKMVENLVQSAEIKEKELMQIFVPLSDDFKETEKEVNDIYTQTKDNPKLFAQLAKSYAEKDDGYLGWFAAGELAPALEKAVQPLTAGTISKPIQTATGFHIIKVLDERETQKFDTEPFTEYKLYAVDFKTLSEKQKAELETAKSHFTKLGDMKEYLLKNKDALPLIAHGEKTWMKAEDLPKELDAKKLAEKTFTPLYTTGENTQLYYVIETRTQLPEKLRVYKERVTTRLIENRTNLMARRFMMDLRRRAFVEVRL